MTYNIYDDIPPSCTRPERNALLAQLSAADKRRVFPELELVEPKLGAVVYEADELINHVYFPVDCLLSTLYETMDGETAGISLTGSDGFTGASMLLGNGRSPTWTVVQSAGKAYRLNARAVRKLFDNNAMLHDLLLRHIQIQLVESSQLAACNRHHRVEQRFCRWLLRTADRSRNNSVEMTQQLIANVLGVRREGVTVAAGKLQQLGLISCQRGNITIADRAGVEERACECYVVIKQTSDRLLSQGASLARAV